MTDEITQGLIYQITSAATPLVYIGSTTKRLKERFWGHKRDYNQWVKGNYNYITSFEILKFDDAKIELIEEFTCNDIQELRRREGEIIQRTENCVNRCIAGRTRSEFLAEYREKNKDRLREMDAKYREKNKGKIREWRVKHYEANKDKINEQHTKYRQANKDKIHQKFNCDCGGRYTHQKKSVHFKTAIHQTYLAKQKRITIEVDSDVDLIDDLDCLSLGYE